jgi:hypothetical protein
MVHFFFIALSPFFGLLFVVRRAWFAGTFFTHIFMRPSAPLPPGIIVAEERSASADGRVNVPSPRWGEGQGEGDRNDKNIITVEDDTKAMCC